MVQEARMAEGEGEELSRHHFKSISLVNPVCMHSCTKTYAAFRFRELSLPPAARFGTITGPSPGNVGSDAGIDCGALLGFELACCALGLGTEEGDGPEGGAAAIDGTRCREPLSNKLGISPERGLVSFER
jgi:hypothetical protein